MRDIAIGCWRTILTPACGRFAIGLAKVLFCSGLLCLSLAAMTVLHAAGLQRIHVPADQTGPELAGAVWSPCALPPGNVDLGRAFPLPGTLDCPIAASSLPLIVLSHGYGGSFSDLHDLAEALADAGFVVAAITHPAERGPGSHADELSAIIERPIDMKRLISFMIERWSEHAKIDAARIGVAGFSRGGYTALALGGGEPDWRKLTAICPPSSPLPYCAGARGNQPVAAIEPLNDLRIKAAVLLDPAFGPLFLPDGLTHVQVPIQLWASTYSGNNLSLDGVSPSNVAAINDALPRPHEYRVADNATHFAFLPPCHLKTGQEINIVCLDAPGFDRQVFHRVFTAAVTQFFQAHLR